MIKKIPACFLIIALISGGLQNASAQQGDTLKDKKPAVVPADLPDSIKKLPARVATLERKTTANNTAVKDSTGCNSCPVKCNADTAHLGARWWLIFLPVILFFVVGGFFIFLILRGKFDLAATLSTGKSQTITTQDNTVTTQAVGSTSRLIAFLTGITAILVALCLVTYYAYFTLAECGGNLQFEGLWKILAGLGIGIVPYGVNVWRGNNKEKDTNSENNNA